MLGLFFFLGIMLVSMWILYPIYVAARRSMMLENLRQEYLAEIEKHNNILRQSKMPSDLDIDNLKHKHDAYIRAYHAGL